MRNPNSKWRIAGLFLSGAAAIGLAQAVNSNPSVAGRVTSSATGGPILHAHVSLFPQSGGRQRYGALAGADGRFSIANVPAGQYRVSADAAGFEMPRIIPGRRAGVANGFEIPRIIPGQRADLLVLGPGEHKDDLDLALTPLGAISGRVLDSEGRPMQGVGISVVGADGLRDGDVSAPDGQFRVGSLPPGEYRLRAVPRALNLPPEIRSDGTIESHYVTTYYPASLAAESAAPLEVAPGLERAGADIRLLRSPIVVVRGVVTGIPAGVQNLGIAVRKVEPPRAPGDALGTIATLGWAHRVNPDGSFEIWGLEPGAYILTVNGNGAIRTPPQVEVRVGVKDMDGVVVPLTR